MTREVTKAIILAAGYGTRFLPMTKATPKEMLPVVDKPVIQYVVEDAVAAGIRDVIIVTNSQKRPIEDHFDHSFELETVLSSANKQELLEEVRRIGDLANFIYIRQKGPKGTLPAIQCGWEAIGDEPFLVLFGDDFFTAVPTRSEQLVAAYQKYRAPILAAIQTSDPEHTKRFGYVAGQMLDDGVIKVEKIIEKPGPEKVPSNYAVVSGYVFTPELMEFGRHVSPMSNGEYSYTDAFAAMLAAGQPVYAKVIDNGTYYDCGNKLDYLKTNVTLTLERDDLKDDFRVFLEDTLKK